MPLSLESLRRASNPDLQDAVFSDASEVFDDWRSIVPAIIRAKWPDMSMGERLGVVLLARELTRHAQSVAANEGIQMSPAGREEGLREYDSV